MTTFKCNFITYTYCHFLFLSLKLCVYFLTLQTKTKTKQNRGYLEYVANARGFMVFDERCTLELKPK